MSQYEIRLRLHFYNYETRKDVVGSEKLKIFKQESDILYIIESSLLGFDIISHTFTGDVFSGVIKLNNKYLGDNSTTVQEL